jgi:hypothetical protein
MTSSLLARAADEKTKSHEEEHLSVADWDRGHGHLLSTRIPAEGRIPQDDLAAAFAARGIGRRIIWRRAGAIEFVDAAGRAPGKQR